MSMHSAFVMLRFELMQYLRTPLIWLLIILGPALSIGSILVSLRGSQHTLNDRVYTVIVYGASHRLLDQANEVLSLRAKGDSSMLRLTLIPGSLSAAIEGATSEVADQRYEVQSGNASHPGEIRNSFPNSNYDPSYSADLSQCDAAFLLDSSSFGRTLRVLRSTQKTSFLNEYTRSVLEDCLNQGVKQNTLRLQMFDAHQTREHENTLQSLMAAISMLILFMSMVGSASQLLLRSLFEERSTSVLDVLLSSSSPQQVLVVKYGTVLMLGLLQSALWFVGMELSGVVTVLHLSISTMLSMLGSAYGSFTVCSATALVVSARVEREGSAQALSALFGMIAIVPLMVLVNNDTSIGDALCGLLPLCSVVYRGAAMLVHQEFRPALLLIPALSSVLTSFVLVYAAVILFRRRLQSGRSASSTNLSPKA